MGAAEFGECFANQTNTNLEQIQHWAETVPPDQIRTAVHWLQHNVPAWVVSTFTFLSNDAMKAWIRRALVGVVSAEAIEFIILLLGVVAWADLIQAAVHCLDRLDA